jgi:serine/threonine-protein kinase HipA
MPASVRLYGQPAGLLQVDRRGDLSFEYLPEHLQRAVAGDLQAHHLSVSLPLRAGIFEQAEAGPFFAGLLPDGQPARDALARLLEIDAADDYGLLVGLGRECPGAVSIRAIDDPIDPAGGAGRVYAPLSTAQLASHIRELPRRPLFFDADGELRLSLAGVHRKAAVTLVDRQVALPVGQSPTSHILKIDIEGLPGSILVEHFCMLLARALNISTPRTQIRAAEDQLFMLVARYDRALVESPQGRFLRRLHQEDFCQALGRYPRQKYEKDGGPGWRECFALANQTEDPARCREELLDRAIFQFLVGNPDAHAKNYSLVYRRGGLTLSPLYDVNNAAAFKSFFKAQRPRLAMAIGGERNPDALTPDHWAAFARDVGLRPELAQDRLSGMAGALTEKATALRRSLAGTLADTPLLDLALDDMRRRADAIQR